MGARFFSLLLGFFISLLGVPGPAAAEESSLKDFEVCGYGHARPGTVFPGNRGMQEPVDLYCTGVAYSVGLNLGTAQRLPQNKPLGFEYVMKAAQQGYAPAQAYLGLMYANGVGIQQNFAEAAAWYRKAAEAGHAQAANNLGLLYKEGKGVPRDAAEAERWLKIAVSGGSGIAADNAYWQQHKTPPQPDSADYDEGSRLYNARDFAGSFQHYLRAAQAGNGYAAIMVGLDYEAGQGVQQNVQQAVAWYLKAANAGFPVAQSCLGNLYAAGKGVPRNDGEALKWYQKSAEQRDASGYYGLGRAYEYGFAVRKDRQIAIQYYEKAGARGLWDGTKMAEYLKDPNHPDLPPDYSWYNQGGGGQASGNVMGHIAAERNRAYQDYVQRETMRQRDQGIVCSSCSANGLAPHP